MFKSATLKLTLVYLGIFSVISVFFSYNWYNVAVGEIEQGFQREARFIETRRGLLVPRDNIEELLGQRQEAFSQARQNIATKIIISNIILLLLGSVGSYFLARRTLRPIEEAHEAQTRFTADASHELRTPLAAMQSEIEVALRDNKLTKKEAISLLKSNLEELAKLTNLSDGLLKLARQDNADNIVMTPTGLPNVISTVAKRLSMEAIKDNIIIEEKSLNIEVMADKTSLEELLTILLQNAVKYSPRNTKVEIGGKQDKKYVQVYVKDEGVGLRASEIPHIFDRFYRGDSSRSKKKTHGYGLGLAIAQNIAKLHHTSIEVKSAPGRGSTFSLRLQRA